ncbi:MAG: hypothetical protein QOJ79_2535 [Actinomycetota bacterium]|jgi:hypothetical protein|nr:hypothetical protein [Actinomycetota bacterium]
MTPAPTAAVRAWARANGYAVSDRGRIPLEIQAAYDAAHPEPAATAQSAAEPGSEQSPPEQSPWSAQPPPWLGQPEPQQWAPQQWAPPPGQPAWPPPIEQSRDGFAVAALVLGILPVCVGVLGIVFGIIALIRIAGTAKRGRGMAIAGIVCGALWIVGVAAALLIGATVGPDRDRMGTVTSEGDVGVTHLQVGDCIESAPVALVRTVHVVPCLHAHAAEVFARFNMVGNDYPGAAQVSRYAAGGCQTRITSYVGTAAQDRYDVLYLAPTSRFWSRGDRNVTCLLGGPDGTTLTGTARIA